MGEQSFEKFYYSRVALGEGCGCAEMVIRTRELDDESAAIEAQGGGGFWSRLRRRLLGRRLDASVES